MIIGGHHLLGLDPLRVQLAELVDSTSDNGFSTERAGNPGIEPGSASCLCTQGIDSPLSRSSVQPSGL